MMTYNVWKTAGFSKIPIYSFMICVFSHTHTQKKKHTPIGSMYAIYTPNVSIYTVHGSYGTVYDWYNSSDYSHLEMSQPSCCDSRPSVRRSELCRISCKWTILEKKKQYHQNAKHRLTRMNVHIVCMYVCMYVYIYIYRNYVAKPYTSTLIIYIYIYGIYIYGIYIYIYMWQIYIYIYILHTLYIYIYT